jgi:hypothetical protein
MQYTDAKRENRYFCHFPSFFTFPAVPSALLALGFASGSHDAPRAEAGKVVVMGHERKYHFATREPEGNPTGESIYIFFDVCIVHSFTK